MKPSGSSKANRDKTLRKGLCIIEALTVSGRQDLRNIAKTCELTRANTHQLLQTLVDEGFVHQDEDTGQYSTTLKLWEIGARNLEQRDIVTPCKGVMKELLADFNETVNLSILDGEEVLYLHKEDSGQGIGSFTRIGERAPAHCVATGKAMIAFDSEGEVAWKRHKLTRFSDTTIVDQDAFILEMRETKKRGYSTLWGEWRGEVVACAAPILGLDQNVHAAIGVSGPKDRMDADRVSEIGEKLRAATTKLSENEFSSKHMQGGSSD